MDDAAVKRYLKERDLVEYPQDDEGKIPPEASSSGGAIAS